MGELKNLENECNLTSTKFATSPSQRTIFQKIEYVANNFQFFIGDKNYDRSTVQE